MIYLAKMINDKGWEVCKSFFPFPIEDYFMYDYKLTVLDDAGNQVDNYRYEDLYGARLTQDSQSIALHVVMKEHWKLYNFLLYEGVVPANNEVVMKNQEESIRFRLEKDECFIFNNEDSSDFEMKDFYTLAGILLNTTADTDTETGCWRIDGDILTVRATDCNVLYKITDTTKFNRVLAKLPSLKPH